MVHQREHMWATVIFGLATCGAGFIVLAFVSIIEDYATREWAAEHDKDIDGRCRCCGRLRHTGKEIYVEEVDEEVPLCIYGKMAYEGDNREDVLYAIKTPFIIKWLSP